MSERDSQPTSFTSKDESFAVSALRARFADESMPWTRPHVESLINQIAELTKQRDEGWSNFYALRKQVAEERYPGMTGVVRAHETGCVHPLGKLMYHGFVSGRVGDYRCEGCQAIVYLPSLDSREWAAARAEIKGSTPAETTGADRFQEALRQIKAIKDIGADWPNEPGGPVVNQPAAERDAMYEVAVKALAPVCTCGALWQEINAGRHRPGCPAEKASAPTTCDTKCFGWPRCECGRRMP
jgi:hypothetical protein